MDGSIFKVEADLFLVLKSTHLIFHAPQILLKFNINIVNFVKDKLAAIFSNLIAGRSIPNSYIEIHT
jgi:hypothetical protein